MLKEHFLCGEIIDKMNKIKKTPKKWTDELKSLDSVFSFPLRTSSFGIPPAFQKPYKRLGRKRQ